MDLKGKQSQNRWSIYKQKQLQNRSALSTSQNPSRRALDSFKKSDSWAILQKGLSRPNRITENILKPFQNKLFDFLNLCTLFNQSKFHRLGVSVPKTVFFQQDRVVYFSFLGWWPWPSKFRYYDLSKINDINSFMGSQMAHEDVDQKTTQSFYMCRYAHYWQVRWRQRLARKGDRSQRRQKVCSRTRTEANPQKSGPILDPAGHELVNFPPQVPHERDAKVQVPPANLQIRQKGDSELHSQGAREQRRAFERRAGETLSSGRFLTDRPSLAMRPISSSTFASKSTIWSSCWQESSCSASRASSFWTWRTRR